MRTSEGQNVLDVLEMRPHWDGQRRDGAFIWRNMLEIYCHRVRGHEVSVREEDGQG